RKRLGLLMDGQKPLGGKWTFDQQNRKKIPKNIDLPRHLKLEINKYIEEAKTYVQKYFSDNPGDIDNFGYAVTREDALRILDYFFEYNIQSFGPYQDAIDTRDDYWFHSVISPYLNIGLITIQDVLNRLISLPTL
ncbi:MAG: cryptochrome/photolyase family protein, partial [Candidatus Bathyarchaeia archaeon]